MTIVLPRLATVTAHGPTVASKVPGHHGVMVDELYDALPIASIIIQYPRTLKRLLMPERSKSWWIHCNGVLTVPGAQDWDYRFLGLPSHGHATGFCWLREGLRNLNRTHWHKLKYGPEGVVGVQPSGGPRTTGRACRS